MKSIINHEVYGVIEYEESFWTGKRVIKVNGQPLKKIDKKTFVLEGGEKPVYFSIRGSFFAGVKAYINGHAINLTPPTKWYEYIATVIIFAIGVLFGAIGGAIGALLGLSQLLVVKSVKNVWLKLLIGAAFVVAAAGICFGVSLVVALLLA